MIYKEEDYDAEQNARDLRNSIRFVEDPLCDTLAVDFDGTLVEKLSGPFDKNKIGPVIQAEMDRVLDALEFGRKVVIFTARAADPANIPPIRKWLEDRAEEYEYDPLGELEITNQKTPDISEFHDDRAKEILPGGVMKSDADIIKTFVEKRNTEEGGEWKTIRGRRVFLKDGETPTQAVARDIKEQGVNPTGGPVATPQASQAVTTGPGLSELVGANPPAATSQPVQQPKAVNPTESPEFKKWFGASKVVDAEGKPLVMYHATTKDFKTFDINQATDYSDTGVGFRSFFFTSDKTANHVEGRDNGNIMPVYVRITNPIPRWTGDWKKDKEFYSKDASSKYSTEEWLKRGYDGIIHKMGSGQIVVQALSAGQIKSAIGNSGKFNPKDSDITKNDDGVSKSFEPQAGLTSAVPQKKSGVESVTFKKPLRKTRTVLMKVASETETRIFGRECDGDGVEFGPEQTLEKRHVTLRKAIPVRYDLKTPSPVPQMTMPEQLKHLAGTAEDPTPQAQPDEFGRFPVDPTLRELKTPDRSTYEQGVDHAFKEEYIRNDVRGADQRKQDLPGA